MSHIPQVSHYLHDNRYKIDIYVKSGDAKLRFVFWDTDCAAIIKKSAADMHQLMIEVRINMHSMIHLQGYCGKKFNWL